VILVSGMVYLTVQQNFRGAANDPQVQIATDARNALESGATPDALVPATRIDIATSLAPYLAVFDGAGRPVASSATLGGQPIAPPSGVFDSAKAMGEDTLTWQPAPGVRSAIVVLPYAGGYVLAGRSLKLTEDREDQLLLQVVSACLATLAVTYVAVLATRLVAPRLAPADR